MSRLSALLDRHVPRWRSGSRQLAKALYERGRALLKETRSLAARPRAAALWAGFAGMRRGLRPADSIALAAVPFEAYCASCNAAPVESAEALAAGTFDSPRLWTVTPSKPIPDHCRVLKVEGSPDPWLAPEYLTYPAGQRAYLRLRSGIVFPKIGVVMPEPGVVFQNTPRKWWPEHRLISGFVGFENDKLLARVGNLHPSRHIRQPVLVVCHIFHRNYGHWLFECLPHVIPWLDHLRDGRLAILVPPLLGAWQRRSLELLGVPPAAVIEAKEESVLCADMIAPGLVPQRSPKPEAGSTSAAATPVWPEMGRAVNEAIGALQAAVRPAAHIEQPDRIYISRRDLVSFRIMLNEAEVEAEMARLGFKIVRPQEFSIDDQVRMFARARVVAGPQGAGMTNAAFAPPGCLVIDILPDNWGTAWMLRLTHLFDHYLLPVVYAADAEQSRPVLLNGHPIAQSKVYRVPVGDLTAVVTSAMRSLALDADRAAAAN